MIGMEGTERMVNKDTEMIGRGGMVGDIYSFSGQFIHIFIPIG